MKSELRSMIEFGGFSAFVAGIMFNGALAQLFKGDFIFFSLMIALMVLNAYLWRKRHKLAIKLIIEESIRYTLSEKGRLNRESICSRN